MAQTINTNVASLNAQRNLTNSQGSLATSLQRLSSGLRINSAKDDAAGLAIAERMNSQVRGMNVAVRNANDAISLSQTAEGSLSGISDSLQRMRELAIQSMNATNTTEDRTALNNEFAALQEEIGRTIDNSKFNDTKLFDASAATGFKFQVGSGTSADNQITIKSTDLTLATSKINIASDKATTKIDITDVTKASAAVTAIDAAIKETSETRSTFGAAQSRLNAVISNLQVGVENTAAARGRIIDADFATETANLSRTQILQQAGTAMVAQANQLPQGVLSLLR